MGFNNTGIFKRFLGSFGEKDLVGIDIGNSAVKVAKITGSPRNYHLQKYVSIPFSEGAIIDCEIQKREEVVEAIVEAISSASIKETNVCIGMSGPNTITKKLQVSDGTEEEIEDQVIWESEQYLPFDLDEAKISIHVLGENQSGGIDVVIGAAKDVAISEIKEIVEESGLKVKIIDLETYALVNVVEVILADVMEKMDYSWMVLDIGAQNTSAIIYRGKRIVYSKEVSMGGILITEEIQRTMSVTYAEAEDLKSLNSGGQEFPQEILDIVNRVLMSVFNEIKKIIDFYHNSTAGETIEKCFVTGGMFLLPMALDYLKEVIDMEVEKLNPFDKITFNKKNIKENIDEVALKSIVVMGLAMRKSND